MQFADEQAVVSGPYKAAYTERFKTKYGNFCAIFYPGDLCVYGKVRETQQGPIEGKRKLESMKKMMRYLEPDLKLPSDVFLKAQLRMVTPVE